MSNSVQAISKGVRLSPRKVGVVAALVRGRSVADALVILQHTPRRAAKPIAKVITSAKANATHNAGLSEQSLVISTISITPGTITKRWKPAARGRALPIAKRSSHIHVIVSGELKPKKPATAAKPAKTKKEKE